MYKTIILQDQGMTTTEPIAITELSDIMLSALTGAVLQVKEQTSSLPEEEQTNFNEELFDILNMSFSSALDRMFPEIVLRPDLTEEAIMRAENEILEEKLNQEPTKEE